MTVEEPRITYRSIKEIVDTLEPDRYESEKDVYEFSNGRKFDSPKDPYA